MPQGYRATQRQEADTHGGEEKEESEIDRSTSRAKNAPRYVYAVIMLFLSHVIGIILQFNGTFYLELVPYDFPLVVLHTISITSFHLWCMLGGSV